MTKSLLSRIGSIVAIDGSPNVPHASGAEREQKVSSSPHGRLGGHSRPNCCTDEKGPQCRERVGSSRQPPVDLCQRLLVADERATVIRRSGCTPGRQWSVPSVKSSIPAKIRADACKLASTCVSIMGPPSSHLANFSISQLFSHFGWVMSWIFWPWPSRQRWRTRSPAAKDLDLAIVEDCRPEFAIDTDVFLGPVVQSRQQNSTNPRRFHAHRLSNVIITMPSVSPAYFPKAGQPGGGCERLALSPGEVCHQVKVMHCTFDHQWIGAWCDGT